MSTQGTNVLVCPGCATVMTPPHAQISVPCASSAGAVPISTVGAPPEIHGAGVTGTQGIGVKTPSAAAVAAMTVGFAVLWHIANGVILTIGMESSSVAAGVPPTIVRLAGNTFSTPDAPPNEHCNVAPAHTCKFAINSH
jgi:hypothetical protein